MALKIRSNYIEPTDNAVGNNLSIGTFVSSAVSTDPMNKINSSKTKCVDICADDGGANLGTTDVRATRSRMLLTTAQSGAASIAGFMGQLKNTAADTTTGNKCGVKGYYEASATATVATGSAGVMGMLDVPSGGVIAAGYASGVKASSVDLGGTHTGKAVGFAVDTPVAGTWDAALWLTTAGGSAQSGSGAANGTIIGKVKVYIDGVLGYINVYPTNN
jgi:hypothetical protein